MKTIVKLLAVLSVLGFLGLVGFAYLGPILGYEIAPAQIEQSQNIVLDK